MKRVLQISALVLLAVYMVFTLILWGDGDKDKVCENFYVEIADNGNKLVTAYEVYQYVGQHDMIPKGKKIGEIDLIALEQCISQISLLCNVNCYYDSKGDVYLKAEQRIPIMRIISHTGDNYYIDKLGARIEVDTMYNDYVPLVMGHIDDTLTAHQLIPLVTYIDNHPLWSVQIDQICVNRNHEIELYPRVGNHVILMGDKEDYKRKLQNVEALYEQVLPQVGWAAYDTIMVKYEDQVICTRRNKSYKHKTYDKEQRKVI